MNKIIDLLLGRIKPKHSSVRASCCGKKRKASQCVYVSTYDGSVFKCKEGYGCKKPGHAVRELFKTIPKGKYDQHYKGEPR